MGSRRLLVGAGYFGAFYGVAHTFFHNVVCPFTTRGPSMSPTLDERTDSVWVLRWLDPVKDLRVGDVVYFRSPVDCVLDGMQPGLIKRIKGVPGDTIKVVFRSRYQIGYPDTDDEQNETIIQVPPGHLWVEGDNPSRSVDSRMWGPLPMSLVEGKILSRGNFFTRKARDLSVPEHVKRTWERQAREIVEAQAAAKNSAELMCGHTVEAISKASSREPVDRSIV